MQSILYCSGQSGTVFDYSDKVVSCCWYKFLFDCVTLGENVIDQCVIPAVTDLFLRLYVYSYCAVTAVLNV